MINTHYNPRDIVYVVERVPYDWRLAVKVCEVEDQYGDKVCVSFVTPKDSRIIDGIPIDQFEKTKLKKLPKNWMASAKTTDLYELTYDKSLYEKLSTIKLDDKAAIRKGLDEKVLVSGRRKLSIQTDITKEGYYVYTHFETRERVSGTYGWNEIYDDYESAKEYIAAYYAELDRQSSLTDEEWSKEEILHTIDHYTSVYHVTDDELARIKDVVFGLEHIEDVEVRIHDGFLQWKYVKKKRWNTV